MKRTVTFCIQRMLLFQIFQNDLCGHYNGIFNHFCTFCFSFRRIFFHSPAENAAAGRSVSFFKPVMKLVGDSKTSCDLRIPRSSAAEEIANAHGCAGEGAADTSSAAKTPRETGAHGDGIIRYFHVKMFPNRIDY